MLARLVTWRVLAGSLLLSGVLALALAYTRYELSNAKEVIQSLVKWQDGIVETTRLATGSPGVTKDNVASEIQQLGVIRITLTNAVEMQNKAIDDMARQTAAAKQAARRAHQAKARSIRQAETIRIQFRQRALTPVAPEQMEVEVRRVQDELYEAGL